jgi:hypothetical protein
MTHKKYNKKTLYIPKEILITISSGVYFCNSFPANPGRRKSSQYYGAEWGAVLLVEWHT